MIGNERGRILSLEEAENQLKKNLHDIIAQLVIPFSSNSGPDFQFSSIRRCAQNVYLKTLLFVAFSNQFLRFCATFIA